MKYNIHIENIEDGNITKATKIKFEQLKQLLYKLEYKNLKNVKEATASKGKHKNSKSTDKNKITR